MSSRRGLAAQGAQDDGGFHAPGLELFDWAPLWPGVLPDWVTKPVLITALSVIIVVAFFWSAFGRPKLIPRGVQNLGEVGYLFVRDQIARPMIGKEGDRWMPLLVSLFFFILVMNLMGVVPVMQFPATSHFAFPLVLALGVWGLVLFVSVKEQGFVSYFKGVMFPPGMPKPLYLLLAPIELLQHLVLRPFTHSVRLFANMFAGHILVAFFAVVGFHFLLDHFSWKGLPIGLLGVVMTVVITGFEIFVQALQAFIFTLLAASYIGGALHPEH